MMMLLMGEGVIVNVDEGLCWFKCVVEVNMLYV